MRGSGGIILMGSSFLTPYPKDGILIKKTTKNRSQIMFNGWKILILKLKQVSK